MIRGELGEEFVVRDTRGGCQAGLSADLRPYRLCYLRRRPDPFQIFGDVEISLVEREWLDDRRVRGEKRADLERHRLVNIEARLYEDQVGTFALGGDRRHCGVHAEFPRFVACGGDNAALARAADGNRFAAQFRIVALLHRGVERSMSIWMILRCRVGSSETCLVGSTALRARPSRSLSCASMNVRPRGLPHLSYPPS